MIHRAQLHLIHSVRGRLTLLVLAVLVPALILASLLIFQAYRNERTAVAEKLLSTARAVAGVVDGEIGEARMLLKSLASTNAIARDDLRGLDAVARRALKGDERWFVVHDANAQQIINTHVARGTPLPRTEHEPEFAAALQRGEDYVSNLRHSPVANTLVVQISHPFAVDGHVKYSLSVAMRHSTLARAIHVERYIPSAVVGVLDRHGVIIARSHSPEKFVGGRATPDMVKAAAENTEGVIDSVTLEGIPVLTAHSRAACGWSVIIGVPKAELYTAAHRLLLLGVLSSGLLAVIATAMAFWIGRAVVRGVDALSAAAETVGRGDMPLAQTNGLAETDAVAQTMRRTAQTLAHRTHTMAVLNRVNAGLVAERDLEKIVQSVTDAGRDVSGAAFGAFFYNVENARGESYMLYTLSGAPREAFEKFGMPRNTAVFAPTFAGTGVMRVADITADPRYGKMGPHHGMPQGHLPVRSYLAVPVKSRTGEVLGGLFFGHPDVDVFTAEAEQIIVGLAAEAAIAIDNAKLYHALERQLEAKKKVEAELRAAQQDLERKVDERTASLREAVTQMEEFSYTVSHDLRSPLRAMNSYAIALTEDCGPQLDETARDYVRRIQRASERMDQLTRDVLNYSRVSRSQVKLAATDVERIVRGTIEHYGELQPPAAEVSVVSPLHQVLAHEPSLTQCIANLLTNAVKFVRPGEKPRVTVRTERIGPRVRIWIEDQGIGIPPQFQSGLFRMFERGPTHGGYEGTGVGLAIVKKSAEKMGGTCGVESDGQNGSRFWIELSQAEDNAPLPPVA